MNFSYNAASWGLQNILPLFNNAKLVFYTAPQPATAETALASTNTALATFTFTANAFGNPSFSTPNEAATASFVAASVVPGANGAVAFARATLSYATWTGAATYSTLFTIVLNSNNFYILTKTGIAAASPGPTATAVAVPPAAITDGGCQWAFFCATASTALGGLADFSVGTGGTDIVIGSTNITTSVNVTMTSFVLQTTAS